MTLLFGVAADLVSRIVTAEKHDVFVNVVAFVKMQRTMVRVDKGQQHVGKSVDFFGVFQFAEVGDVGFVMKIEDVGAAAFAHLLQHLLNGIGFVTQREHNLGEFFAVAVGKHFEVLRAAAFKRAGIGSFAGVSQRIDKVIIIHGGDGFGRNAVVHQAVDDFFAGLAEVVKKFQFPPDRRVVQPIVSGVIFRRERGVAVVQRFLINLSGIGIRGGKQSAVGTVENAVKIKTDGKAFFRRCPRYLRIANVGPEAVGVQQEVDFGFELLNFYAADKPFLGAGKFLIFAAVAAFGRVGAVFEKLSVGQRIHFVSYCGNKNSFGRQSFVILRFAHDFVRIILSI